MTPKSRFAISYLTNVDLAQLMSKLTVSCELYVDDVYCGIFYLNVDENKNVVGNILCNIVPKESITLKKEFIPFSVSLLKDGPLSDNFPKVNFVCSDGVWNNSNYGIRFPLHYIKNAITNLVIYKKTYIDQNEPMLCSLSIVDDNSNVGPYEMDIIMHYDPLEKLWVGDLESQDPSAVPDLKAFLQEVYIKSWPDGGLTMNLYFDRWNG